MFQQHPQLVKDVDFMKYDPEADKSSPIELSNPLTEADALAALAAGWSRQM